MRIERRDSHKNPNIRAGVNEGRAAVVEYKYIAEHVMYPLDGLERQ